MWYCVLCETVSQDRIMMNDFISRLTLWRYSLAKVTLVKLPGVAESEKRTVFGIFTLYVHVHMYIHDCFLFVGIKNHQSKEKENGNL